MSDNHPLEDFKINIKLKLAALWTSVYGDYFKFYAPREINDLMEGKSMLDTPGKLFAASVLMVVPSLMVFLSVALPPVLNRWLNIVFGVIYTGIMLLIAATSYSPWYTFYVFLAMVESILTAMIVYYAWRWPRNISS
jgi:hypothetical protein